MKVEAVWDAREYRLGQLARLEICVTNDTKHPVLVNGSSVNFRKTDKKCDENLSIIVAPGERERVREIPIRILPWAEKAGATGTLRVKYMSKKGSAWSGPKFKNSSLAALTITDAAPTGQKIFISHSNSDRDKAVVKSAERAVKKAGFVPYVSEKDPSLGGDLWEKILEQVLDCDGVIFLMTKDGIKSHDVREELGYAQMRNAINTNRPAKIVPIVEEGVDPKGSLKGKKYEKIYPRRTTPVAEQIATIVINSFVDLPVDAAGHGAALGTSQEPPAPLEVDSP